MGDFETVLLLSASIKTPTWGMYYGEIVFINPLLSQRCVVTRAVKSIPKLPEAVLATFGDTLSVPF